MCAHANHLLSTQTVFMITVKYVFPVQKIIFSSTAPFLKVMDAVQSLDKCARFNSVQYIRNEDNCLATNLDCIPE